MATNRIKQYRRIQYWENFFLDSAIYSVGQSVGVSYEDGFRPVSAVTGDLFTYMYSEDKPCDSGATNYFLCRKPSKEPIRCLGMVVFTARINKFMMRPTLPSRRSADRWIVGFLCWPGAAAALKWQTVIGWIRSRRAA